MKASLPNYRQSPRKVRLLADILRGKTVAQGLETLKFLPKRAAGPVLKLLQSAAANSRPAATNADRLYIKDVTVNKGLVLKRFRPGAHGRSYAIKKRSSRIDIILGTK